MSKSGSSFRLASALPFAAVATVVIFVAMNGLIKTDPSLRASDPPPDIDIFMEERDPPPDPPDTKRPDDLPDPPKAVKPVWRKEGQTRDIPIIDEEAPKPNINPPVSSNTGGALVKFPPQYPASCQGRGQEGTAVVSYDVTASGQVVNARVVSSSHPCFNKKAIRTIERWKYGPSGKGGNQIVQRNVRQTFRFKLVE